MAVLRNNSRREVGCVQRNTRLLARYIFRRKRSTICVPFFAGGRFFLMRLFAKCLSRKKNLDPFSYSP